MFSVFHKHFQSVDRKIAAARLRLNNKLRKTKQFDKVCSGNASVWICNIREILFYWRCFFIMNINLETKQFCLCTPLKRCNSFLNAVDVTSYWRRKFTWNHLHGEKRSQWNKRGFFRRNQRKINCLSVGRLPADFYY